MSLPWPEYHLWSWPVCTCMSTPTRQHTHSFQLHSTGMWKQDTSKLLFCDPRLDHAHAAPMHFADAVPVHAMHALKDSQGVHPQFHATTHRDQSIFKQIPAMRSRPGQILPNLEYQTCGRTMVLQGFDPMEHTINKFIEFCKRLKFAESFNPNNKPNKTTTQETSSHMDLSGHSMGAQMWPTKSSAQGNKNKKHKHLHDEGKFCKLHHTTDHDTRECKVLKAQAQKMQANWKPHRSNYRQNHKYKNNNDKNKDKKRNRNCEESPLVEEDDALEKHVPLYSCGLTSSYSK